MFSDLEMCMHVAKRHATHGEAMRFARGLGGTRAKFFKMVPFGAF